MIEEEFLGRVWVAKGYRTMLISQMETNHIKNAIRMIRRRNGWRRKQLPYLFEELYTKREMG